MQEIVSIKIDELTAIKVKETYSPYQEENNADYIVFFAKKYDLTITLYESKKGFTLLFVGDNALKEAKLWDSNAFIKEKKIKPKEEWLSLNSQIGSDEVGVGDLFLPMIVVSAYVTKSEISRLIELGIHDSKKMKDDEILALGATLIKEFNFSKLTLLNDKYNEMIDRGENLNSLKAKMHNQALFNLKKKHPEINEIYVDEFVKAETYFKYLKNDKEVLTNIVFRTKGESFYPSVALASVMARYSFLIEKRKLEDKYDMEFPLGAGKKADEFLKEFLNRYGKEELIKISKKNFANMDEIL